MELSSSSIDRPAHKFLSGEGEMSKLIRDYDWSKTSVGPVTEWPQSLVTTLNILLRSKFPMFLWWGKDLVQFYNDAYRPVLGNEGKHPTALGQNGADCWTETWPVIHPLIQQVFTEDEAVWSENQLIPIYRNGSLEDVYWTFSYSPVNDESGNVGGVLVVCTETTKQVNTITTIKQSEERFQNLVREATVGIIVLLGEEMRVDIVNAMYGQLIDRTPEELMGQPLFDIIPEATDPFLPLLLGVLKTGEPRNFYDQPYFVYVNGQKKEGYINIVYQPYKDINGVIIGIMALCHDVTEQVENRKKIEESELFAKNIINTSEAAQIIWKGEDMVFEMANERMLEILGRDSSIIGKPFMEAIPELRDTPLMDRLRDVLRTGKTYYQPEEMFVLMRHGKPYTGYYNYSYAPLRNAAGENYGIICTAADVTNQVVNRQKVEQAEAKARLAIDSASLGTYEIIYATDEMLTSERFDAIWGIEHGLTRKQIVSRIHPDDIPGRQQSHNESIQNGNLHYEARIVWEDGSLHWVRVKGKILYDEKGNPATLLGVVQDINEQKLFAEQLTSVVKERTLELQRSNDDLLQFAHVTSHDLKEPVRKIKVYNGRLMHEFGDLLPEKGRSYLDKVTNAADRMFAMIDGVLKYSALSSSEQTIEIIDLNDIVENIQTDLEVLIHQKNAVITVGELPHIEGVAVLIYQLFYNIINNALKFSKQDVQPLISVTASVIEQNEVLMAQVSIADNGIGFGQEYAEKIFNTFARLNSKDEYEGTGLGLALCKRITDRHSGAIAASGVKKEGAIITFTLPLKQVNKHI